MNNFLDIAFEERAMMFETASVKLKFHEAIIEKDFWVSWVLKYLFEEFPYRNGIVFKGGTCLSKVYDMIQRFSEDIDIAIDWSLLDIDKKEAYEERSNTKQDMFNKMANESTEVCLKEKWLPILQKDFSSKLKDTFRLWIDDDPQTIVFEYPRFFSDSSILQTIHIEVGVLAEAVPCAWHPIHTMIEDAYPNLIKEDANVMAVDIHRTFFEKLTILHREANRVNGNYPKRYSRHFYDIYRMIQKGIGDECLEMIDLLLDVTEFKKKFYPCNWADYDAISNGGLKLICNQDAQDIFEKDYTIMKNMLYGEIPNFDTIIQCLESYEVKINEQIRNVQKRSIKNEN